MNSYTTMPGITTLEQWPSSVSKLSKHERTALLQNRLPARAEVGDTLECTIEWPRRRTRVIPITDDEICRKANLFLAESPNIWKLVKAG